MEIEGVTMKLAQGDRITRVRRAKNHLTKEVKYLWSYAGRSWIKCIKQKTTNRWSFFKT